MKTTQTITPRKPLDLESSKGNSRFVCPSCRGSLHRSVDTWECPRESFIFPAVAGIPDFVIPTRREHVSQFLRIYQDVRKIEEWGDGSPEFVLGLPYEDKTGKHPGNWHIRSRTYECFIADLRQIAPEPARVLDLGAGNCWLSLRLRNQEYHVTAVDVNLDERDGMQAARLAIPHIRSVDLVRAEFEYLPFADASFDVIVFNSSLHYTKDPLAALRRVSRLLSHGGYIYVLDSPVYKHEKHGDAMVRERRKEIGRLVGREIPDELGGSYLTFDRMTQLEAEYTVRMLRPKYGFLWNVRPVLASILRRRQPAAFMVARLAPRTPGMT